MNITIDGKIIKFNSNDENIVDIADRSKIGIPAPCYRAKKSKGCCSTCVVEIDGEQKFACATKPKDGMNIIVNRLDLKLIRKKRLLKYTEGIKNDNSCGCNCSTSCNCC